VTLLHNPRGLVRGHSLWYPNVCIADQTRRKARFDDPFEHALENIPLAKTLAVGARKCRMTRGFSMTDRRPFTNTITGGLGLHAPIAPVVKSLFLYHDSVVPLSLDAGCEMQALVMTGDDRGCGLKRRKI
jgi:hypothetical protein